MALGIGIEVILLNLSKLSVAFSSCYTGCYHAECYDVGCRYAECQYADCRGAIEIFTKLALASKSSRAECYKNYICNLRMFVISQSVCPWQDFPAYYKVCG
jgi:hypothetical protein